MQVPHDTKAPAVKPPKPTPDVLARLSTGDAQAAREAFGGMQVFKAAAFDAQNQLDAALAHRDQARAKAVEAQDRFVALGTKLCDVHNLQPGAVVLDVDAGVFRKR